MKNSIDVQTFTNTLVDERMYYFRVNEIAVVVDPFESDELIEIINVQEIRKVIILLTHEHYDHISGVNKLRACFDVTVYASSKCKDNIENPQKNTTKSFPFLFLKDPPKYKWAKSSLKLPYFCTVDVPFDDELEIHCHDIKIMSKYVGGHSAGSSFYFVGTDILFAGDNLLGNGMELNSYGSDKEQYYNFVIPYISKLDPQTVIYPGHGDKKVLLQFLNSNMKGRFLNEH